MLYIVDQNYNKLYNKIGILQIKMKGIVYG